jgi:hypothetical protein
MSSLTINLFSSKQRSPANEVCIPAAAALLVIAVIRTPQAIV